MRTAKEILEDHLKLSKEGTVEEDLKRNYAEDVKLLTTYGNFEGHEGMRILADKLKHQLPEASFEYKNVLIQGEIGFFEWTGYSKNKKVEDGADSYVIRDGRIVAQTIHYTVSQK